MRNHPFLRRLTSTTALTFYVLGQPAMALPTGGVVSAGSASIGAASAGSLSVVQTSGRAAIDWKGFDIGKGERVDIRQPSSSSVLLNRIGGASPSQILGTLSANGQVILSNPNGMVFGKGARVDVAGLIATTATTDAKAFAKGGNYDFQASGNPNAAVINHGQITVRGSGLAAMVAPQVSNDGQIVAQAGKVQLSSGDRFTLDLYGDGLLSVAADPMLKQQLDQNGQVQGGMVVLSNAQAADAVSGVVNLNGVTEATGLDSNGGTIVTTGGVVNVTGTLKASGKRGGTVRVAAGKLSQQGSILADGDQGEGGTIALSSTQAMIDREGALTRAASSKGKGGTITVNGGDGSLFLSGRYDTTGQQGGHIVATAKDTKLYGARLDASGASAGGVIELGGGWHGSGETAHAGMTDVNFSSTLKADATRKGQGGTIVAWSDERTRFAGKAIAGGGAKGGNGGMIEISSKGELIVSKNATTDASAARGAPGSVLFDPKNLIIDTNGAQGGLVAFELIDPDTASIGANGFGSSIVPLSTGNIVVAANGDDFAASNAGAAYLFNGATGALISTLRGSTANDAVGTSITALTGNGNYFVKSNLWDNGAVADAGAVTWGSGITGVSGTVSAANSLVGAQANDQVGSYIPALLSNGNYLITSPLWDNGAAANAGAVTWGNGATGTSGVVSAANSLVGSTASDGVGNSSATALTNGNYVVGVSDWDNGAVVDAGAVAWGNGATGTSGVISAANALIGTQANDKVGGSGAFPLINGNYIVNSPNWNNGAVATAGAVTWGNGTTGSFGAVSAANSLVGSTASDRVGSGNILTLTNGNYVVRSPNWSNGGQANAGAATWGNGTTGVSGVVSSANSLVGSTASDGVGTRSIALTNGNYVIGAPNFYNSSYRGGAAVWGDGTTGRTGTVYAATPFVGDWTNDQVGNAFTALPNGNYLIVTPTWHNNTGAVTWASGTASTPGYPSSANSLVGSTGTDQVGSSGITVLTNGNYVVRSVNWSNGGTSGVGAVTWGNGTTGTTGAVSATNSLIGSTASDLVGSGFVTALTNGNYVVGSNLWDNGAVVNAGAVTWGNGAGGTVGAVSATNSLVGSTSNDRIGSNIVALTNGNYVVGSYNWSNGAVLNTGASTWGNGTGGTVGAVSAANSLVGTTTNDQVGLNTTTALANGNYVLRTPGWDNGAVVNAGAVTWGNGATGTFGALSATNSLVGSTASDGVGTSILALANGNYVVNSNAWDNGAVVNAGAFTWGNGSSGTAGVINAANSIIGPSANAGAGNITADPLNNHFIAPFTGVGVGRVYVGFGDGPKGLSDFDGFSDQSGQTITLAPSFLTATLNAGTAVSLQASNDITVNSAVTANNPVGNGGALSLMAGRSILLNAPVTTDDGNLTLVANARAADGVLNAYRDAGAATITMNPGSSINAGTGTVTLTLKDGAGNTNTTSGAVDLRNITAGQITASSVTGSDLILDGTLTASGTGDAITLASGGNFINNTGASALSAPAGRWLVYSGDPSLDTPNGLVSDFHRYNCSFGGSCPSFPATGKGSLYRLQPTLTATPNAVSLTYGDAAPSLAGYGYTLSGFINGDVTGTSGITGSLTGSTTYAAGSDVGSYNINKASGSLASSLGYAISYANNATAISVGQKTLGLTAGAGGLVRTYNGTTSGLDAASGIDSTDLTGLYGLDAGSIYFSGGTSTFADKNVGAGKALNYTGLALSGSKAGNYVLSSTSFVSSGIIVAKNVTISGVTASDKVYDRTMAATLSTGGAAVVGGIAGDTVTVNAASAAGTFGNKNVGTGKAVTATGFALSGADAGNYNLTGQPGSLSAAITAKDVTISGVTANDKVYDRTTAATLSTGGAAVAGGIAGDAVTVNAASAAATFGDKNVGTGKAVTATGFALSGVDAGNYNLTGQPGSLSAAITAKDVTISGVTANDKVYDRTTAATLSTGGAAVAGGIAGDAVTVNAASAAATFGDKNVGTGKAVTATGFALSGVDAGNYNLTGQPGSLSADITAKDVTISGVTANDKVYDRTTAATLSTGGAAVAGGIAGDAVTVNAASAAATFGDKNVGTGKAVTATGFALSGADAGNYNLTGQPGSLSADITAKDVTISGVTANDKVYDTTTTATLATGGATVAGRIVGDTVSVDASGSAASFADANAGAGKTVTATGFLLGGADAGNYHLLSQPGSLSATIGAKDVTIAGITADNKTYDGTTAATLSTGGVSVAGRVGTDAVTVNVSGATATFADADAGTGKAVTVGGLTLDGADAGNYHLLAQPSGFLADILRQTLAVTANSTSRAYGVANPAFTGSLTGMVAGDGLTVTRGSAATAGTNIGAYAITNTVNDPLNKLGNYTLSNTDGTLTITRASLSVTGDTLARDYGIANPTLTGSFTGAYAPDGLSVTRSTVAGTSTNIGSYAITNTVNDPGGRLGNYTLTNTDGTLTISPATLTVTSNSVTRDYGQGNPGFTGSFTGALAGDNLGVTRATTVATGAGTDVGSYTIGATISDPGNRLGNYTVSNTGGTLTITPAALTVTADAVTKYYGQTNPTLTGSFSGVYSGDAITVTRSTGATTGTDVGTYGVANTLLDPGNRLGNYTVTNSAGSLQIIPVDLTVTADSFSRVYGAADPVFTGSFGGMVAGDGITVSRGTAATGSSGIGGYAIANTLSDPMNKLGNYHLVDTSGTLTITPAPLSITASAATRLYGDPDPVFGYTVGGLVGADPASLVSGVTLATPAMLASYQGDYAIHGAGGSVASANYTLASYVDGILTITGGPTPPAPAPPASGGPSAPVAPRTTPVPVPVTPILPPAAPVAAAPVPAAPSAPTGEAAPRNDILPSGLARANELVTGNRGILAAATSPGASPTVAAPADDSDAAVHPDSRISATGLTGEASPSEHLYRYSADLAAQLGLSREDASAAN